MPDRKSEGTKQQIDPADSVEENKAEAAQQLEFLLRAASDTARELVAVICFVEAAGLPTHQERMVLLKSWRCLSGYASTLSECLFLDVEGVGLKKRLQTLHRRRARLGLIQAGSYVQVIHSAAEWLLSCLFRLADPRRWQKGTALGQPLTRHVSVLQDKWPSLQTEVARRFKKFPRSQRKLIDKIVREVLLLQAVCGIGEQERERFASSDDDNPGSPPFSVSDSKPADANAPLPSARDDRLPAAHDANLNVALEQALSEAKPILNSMETNIISIIKEAGQRRTTTQILGNMLTAGYPCAEGPVKACLANLVRREILDNRQDTKPPGYGVVE